MFNEKEWLEEVNTVSKYEKMMEMRKWMKEVPYLQFPSDWQIQVIPPFGQAVVRFCVRKGAANVSIYLDCYNKLGIYGSGPNGEPYWEIYPDARDTNARFDMADTEGVLKAIGESIDAQLNSEQGHEECDANTLNQGTKS